MKRIYKWLFYNIVYSNFVKITCDILVDTWYTLIGIIGGNLRNVTMVMSAGLPYLMWYLGVQLYEQRGEFLVGNEIFIPILVFIFTYYIRQFANRIGKGERIPVPERRFTEKGEEYGEFTIESARLEELILYTASLEDWLERKGLLK